MLESVGAEASFVLDECLAEAVNGAQRSAQVVRDRVAEGLELLVLAFEIAQEIRSRLGELFRHLCSDLTRPRQLQVRSHAADQLSRREGLHQVVVGPCLKAAHDRILPRTGGQEHQWNRAGLGVRAERPQESLTVHSRHHDVAENEIRRILNGDLEGGLTVLGRLNPPVRSQQSNQVLTHVGVVVGDEDPRGCLVRFDRGVARRRDRTFGPKVGQLLASVRPCRAGR
jgi:hypothetical protein